MQQCNRLSLYVRIWDIKKPPSFELFFKNYSLCFESIWMIMKDFWFLVPANTLDVKMVLDSKFWRNQCIYNDQMVHVFIYTWNSILYSMGLHRMWMSGEFDVSWLFLISGRTDFSSVSMNTFKFNFSSSLFLPSAPNTIWRKGWKPLATPYWRQRVTGGYARTENAALN